MNKDLEIAQHVEALIGLGWRWEGRGLVPGWQPQNMTAIDDQQLLRESINHPNGGSK